MPESPDPAPAERARLDRQPPQGRGRHSWPCVAWPVPVKRRSFPPYVQPLSTDARPVLVGTPTHRAAMILRRKGVTDAATVHSLCLTPYFTVGVRRGRTLARR